MMRMMRSLRVLLPLVVLLALSCATTANNTDSVRAAMNEFMDALNAGDVDRIAATFADDVTAFVPLAQGERVEGKPALVAIFRAFVAQQKTPTKLAPEDMTIDAGNEIGVVTFQIRSPNVISRRTFVFHRRGGRWLITHFHASNFRPQ